MDILIKGMLLEEIEKNKSFLTHTTDPRKREQLQNQIDRLAEKIAIYDVSDKIYQNIR